MTYVDGYLRENGDEELRGIEFNKWRRSRAQKLERDEETSTTKNDWELNRRSGYTGETHESFGSGRVLRTRESKRIFFLTFNTYEPYTFCRTLFTGLLTIYFNQYIVSPYLRDLYQTQSNISIVLLLCLNKNTHHLT